ncbi:hypothetical protein EJV47_18860 [Hymenobacter gummosus]|uniref:Uncharacterized protein n=1 Tax=Hymenobacter gummosus TaxID=1776032 RepID=A0A431TZB4_9BACT|nr:hypothetical protein [Hymenobacter gummosus]RTQ47486.1 hypothetical protein EJV47_18860 [Hymenobacter gummosus]
MTRLLLLLLSFHLFAVSLLPGADAHELAEVKQAWQHRAAHHADSSLWGFVYAHFVVIGEHEHPGEHAADHQGLPLHHHCHDVSCGPMYPLPAPLHLHPQPLVAYAEAGKLPPHAVPAARAGISRPCWQPPRA